LIRKNPYQQSIADKELVFDKVVLINKEPYPMAYLTNYQSIIEKPTLFNDQSIIDETLN